MLRKHIQPLQHIDTTNLPADIHSHDALAAFHSKW